MGEEVGGLFIKRLHVYSSAHLSVLPLFLFYRHYLTHFEYYYFLVLTHTYIHTLSLSVSLYLPPPLVPTNLYFIMPTLEIQVLPRSMVPLVVVTLENGKTHRGRVNLQETYPIFTHGASGTMTFDSKEDLIGEHDCTCTLTEAGSRVTVANGVVIDNGAPGESVENDNAREINGWIEWFD